MEASITLSALHQHDSPEQSVALVRRYTKTPYTLYLDVSTLSRDTSSTHFPLDWLHLCRLVPFSDTEVVLLQEEGEIGLKMFPHF